ncbi:MAG: hypothetical protein ABIJ50_10980 [Pseudomonadota bacterium]
MSQEEQASISNKQANAGSGAAGIGLGTALVMLAPNITAEPSIIELIQIASPTISVAGAFIFKALFIYFEKQHRLKRISTTTKHIDNLVNDENLSPEYKSQLVNKKQELHMEEIEIMSGSIFKDTKPSQIPNKSLKWTR